MPYAAYVGVWRCDELTDLPVAVARLVDALRVLPTSEHAAIYGHGDLLAYSRRARSGAMEWAIEPLGMRRAIAELAPIYNEAT